MNEETRVSPDEGGRLDVFIAAHAGITRSQVKNLIGQGGVTVNGRPAKASQIVSAGDVVHWTVEPPKSAAALPQDIPLDIVYQDADIAVVNKPRGMVVHPAAGNRDGTLVNALLFQIGDLSGIGGEIRPGIVHRLDKETSGLLVVAKNDAAHLSLSGQIKAKQARRVYRAVLDGVLKTDGGTVNQPVGRHKTDRKKMAVVPGGRSAVTHYRVLERLRGHTYVECILETGRTHQIRVHMKFLGHPVTGDEIYGKKYPCGQLLHAYRLGLVHPRTGEAMEFTAPLPAYFEEALEKLRGE